MTTFDLDDPAQARAYIADWSTRLLGQTPATFVRMSGGRIIEFDTMSDDDACMVARALWDMEQRVNAPPPPANDDRSTS